MLRQATLRGLLVALALLGGCHRGPEPSVADAGGVEQREQSTQRPTQQPTVPPDPPICNGQPCESPRECISYFGIAGPSGPTFYSCEVRCDRNASESCPDGTRCVTIADGPGDVCR